LAPYNFDNVLTGARLSRRNQNGWTASHRLLGRKNRYDVTSNGKRFLMNVPVEQRQAATFTVILNWPAALKG
jgi:hypothetical protein